MKVFGTIVKSLKKVKHVIKFVLAIEAAIDAFNSVLEPTLEKGENEKDL